MKNIVKVFSIVMATSLLGMSIASAELYVGDPVHKASVGRKAAECVPASGSSQLSVNNVRAYIETSGSMWFNSSKAQYFIPASGNAASMFAAALWIGGMDVAGQLKLAALRFKQIGNDFWPGPLVLNDATIDQATCSMYDKHFYMTKVMARNHRDSFNIAGYSMPKEIKDWPGNPIDGNTKQSWYIAPYVDVDGDGSYNPENGDYPYYDFDNALCPWTDANRALAATNRLPQTMETQNNISSGGIMADQVLKGDATLWWIFNDKGAAHTESKGSPIGLEIRAQAFGFATTDELNNMTFYSYEIINRSTYELTETYFSQWVDPDLGYAKDDYVGCDVERGLGYCYNGTAVDGNGLNTEYGANPPAVGVDFFQGPYLDADGYDNPSYKGDNCYGPSFSVNYGNVCEIVTANNNLREFTWHLRLDSATGLWVDTTAMVPVKAEAINGVNFGDGIADNERFGMRRFVYHNNDNSNIGDPSVAVDYYNMLRGIWKDNTPMRYGANGHYSQTGTGAPQCDFMFPGETDPCNWGTNGIDPGILWTEEEVGNSPNDRRFMQSAGPFTLKAGSINYITVGIPWARATGTPWASVLLLKAADDKAQTLFESCFKVVDGPDAPDLVFQETDKKLICYLTNSVSSNNYKEQYSEEDPSIPNYRVKSSIDTKVETIQVVVGVDTIWDAATGTYTLDYIVKDSNITIAIATSDTIKYNDHYVFEGYQVYQLVDGTVGAAELRDNSKARLVYQCDIKNGVATLINYVYDAAVSTEVPISMVEGADAGIAHSFEITTDLFGADLVNHQKYYYMAIAYAYNNYETYGTSSDNPDGLFGQKTPYLAGNKNVKCYTVIPHKNAIEENGTIANSVYGTQPQITQLEGQGNGGNALKLTQATIEEILANGRADSLVFEINAGPIGVKVVDPLQVVGSDYMVRFYNPDSSTNAVTDDTKWQLEYTTAEGVDTIIDAEQSISVLNEQLFLDLGISITIYNAKYTPLADYINPDSRSAYYLYSSVDYISASQETNGSVGLMFFADQGSEGISNWIRAGQTRSGDWALNTQIYEQARQEDYYIKLSNSDGSGVTNGGASTYTCWMDKNKQFESILGAGWAPYALASVYDNGPGYGFESPEYQDAYGNPLDSVRVNASAFQTTYPLMTELYSVDIVFTSDTNLWTRCPVVEIGTDSTATIGHAKRHNLRKSPSVDKQGNPDGTGYGMSWFPGYAICVETGERLNIMFGEDSRIGGGEYNGTDMIFNPGYAVSYNSGVGYNVSGGHYIYIMGHRDLYKDRSINSYTVENVAAARVCPAYDEGAWLYSELKAIEGMAAGNQRNIRKNYLYKNAMWTAIPMTMGKEGDINTWMPKGSSMKISIRVSRPYQKWSSTENTGVTNPTNNNLPLYKFTTKNIATQYNQRDVVETHMDSIYVVPNPYYGVAFGGYENSQVDTRVKIVNLPKSCKIKIFTLEGALVRSFNKPDDGTTYLEWDLKNSANIPVASGMYLIHIRDNEYNFEKTVKFLCIQRPFDVNAF